MDEADKEFLNLSKGPMRKMYKNMGREDLTEPALYLLGKAFEYDSFPDDSANIEMIKRFDELGKRKKGSEITTAELDSIVKETIGKK